MNRFLNLFICGLSCAVFCGCPNGNDDGDDCGMTALNVQEVTLASGLTGYALDYCASSRSDTAVAADAEGAVHVLYRTSGGKLGYATNAGCQWEGTGTWDVQTGGTHNSIALDANGNAHMCTTTGTANEHLIYITDAGGCFAAAIVDDAASVGLENDIALDASGRVHIAHWQWNGANLRYTTNASGAWQSTTVADAAAWTPTAIALDLGGSPLIGYINPADSQLHLASLDGAVWADETVTTVTGGIGNCGGVSAAVAQDGAVLVLSRSGLAALSGTWTVDNIFADILADVGWDRLLLDEDALAVDSQGNVHICFLIVRPVGDDELEAEVAFMSNIDGDWQFGIVDSWTPGSFTYDMDGTFFPPSLALDLTGRAHVAYARTDLFQVRYCSFDPADFMAGEKRMEQ